MFSQPQPPSSIAVSLLPSQPPDGRQMSVLPAPVPFRLPGFSCTSHIENLPRPFPVFWSLSLSPGILFSSFFLVSLLFSRLGKQRAPGKRNSGKTLLHGFFSDQKAFTWLSDFSLSMLRPFDDAMFPFVYGAKSHPCENTCIRLGSLCPISSRIGFFSFYFPSLPHFSSLLPIPQLSRLFSSPCTLPRPLSRHVALSHPKLRHRSSSWSLFFFP